MKYFVASLSSRRAWIEIAIGESSLAVLVGRSPRGERGLKFTGALLGESLNLSLSSRRAWIEIKCQRVSTQKFCCRSPRGERGLKFG